jgi:hypothetical protein
MDVRVRDPAYRDQDAVAFRRGRFAERVRREWNVVSTRTIEASMQGPGSDLEALAKAIQERVGGDVEPLLARLREFMALESDGAPASSDPLVRPGAN